jgi:dCMP deaminase
VLSLGSDKDLDQFVIENDHIVFGPYAHLMQELNGRQTPTTALRSFRNLVNIHVANVFDSLPALYSHLDDTNFLNPERLRPGWDTYFMVTVHCAVSDVILHCRRHSHR